MPLYPTQACRRQGNGKTCWAIRHARVMLSRDYLAALTQNTGLAHTDTTAVVLTTCSQDCCDPRSLDVSVRLSELTAPQGCGASSWLAQSQTPVRCNHSSHAGPAGPAGANGHTLLQTPAPRGATKRARRASKPRSGAWGASWGGSRWSMGVKSGWIRGGSGGWIRGGSGWIRGDQGAATQELGPPRILGV